MAEEYKLSLTSAVIINLNIMLGTGIFLNSIPFAQNAGLFSFVPYLTIGILMVPLIIAMAILLNRQPEGTFYGIAKNDLGALWGFLSTWSYFIAKPASAAIMIHFCCFLFRTLFSQLQIVSHFTLDAIVITIFVMLNLLNMRIGRSIQISFLGLKSIPILFIIISGFWFLNPHNFAPITFPFAGIVTILSLAIYSFTGFEASLSLSQHIKHPQKNAPRAIIISYLIVMSVYMLYQIGYYGALNLGALEATKPFDGIALFLHSIYHTVQPHLQALLYICMGTSALGGAYGILFSNVWNLHGLATHKHLPLCKYLATKNTAGIAYWCLFIEAFLCVMYLLGTNANQIMLQQINAFGCTLAYTTSMFAFAFLAFKTIKKYWAIVLSFFALASCAIFITACVNGFRVHGLTALYAFISLLIIGAILFAVSQRKTA